MTQLSLFDAMKPDDGMSRFEGVRRILHNGEIHYSVVDVIEVLSGSANPRRYWSDLKRRLKIEGSQVYENIVQLKLASSDGKQYKTDLAERQYILRLVQSIPSPLAEPFKVWLAEQGEQKLKERDDPEIAISNALDALSSAERHYREMGKSAEWITARTEGIVTRKAFTDALTAAVKEGIANSGLFAVATDDVYRGVFHLNTTALRHKLSIRQHENPRDHLTRTALYYVAIAEELSAHELGDSQSLTYDQARHIVKQVADLIGMQVDDLQSRLGIDIPTGKRLLKGDS